MAMYGLGDTLISFDDFNLFFVEPEGSENIKGTSEGLFLGLLPLLGITDVHISVGQISTSSGDGVKYLTENTVVSNIFWRMSLQKQFLS